MSFENFMNDVKLIALEEKQILHRKMGQSTAFCGLSGPLEIKCREPEKSPIALHNGEAVVGDLADLNQVGSFFLEKKRFQ